MLKGWGSTTHFATILCCLAACFRTTIGFRRYLEQFPNSRNIVDPNTGEQDLRSGHRDGKTHNGINQFGLDFSHFYVQTGIGWSIEFCLTDSDGDGQINGHELGDPCCLWRHDVEDTNTLLRVEDISHPANRNHTTAAVGCQEFTPEVRAVWDRMHKETSAGDESGKWFEQVWQTVRSFLPYNTPFLWLTLVWVVLMTLLHVCMAPYLPQLYTVVGPRGITIADWLHTCMWTLLLLGYFVPALVLKWNHPAGHWYIVSIAFGEVALICTAATLCLSQRTVTIAQVMVGQRFSTNLPWHKVLGYITIGTTLAHGGILFILHYGRLADVVSPWAVDHTHGFIVPIAGTVGGILVGVLLILTPKCVRRRSYLLFSKSHAVLAILFVLFTIGHVPKAAYLVKVSSLYYILDLVLRYFWKRHQVCLVPGMPSGDDWFTLEVRPPLKHEPGQFIYLNVPGMSRFGWHPFSILSTFNEWGRISRTHLIIRANPHQGEKYSTVSMCEPSEPDASKERKKFTSKLQSWAAGNEEGMCMATVEGPYGRDPFTLDRQSTLIAGGVGCVPILDRLLGLIHSSTKKESTSEPPQDATDCSEADELILSTGEGDVSMPGHQMSEPVMACTFHWSVRDRSLAEYLLPHLTQLVSCGPNQLTLTADIYFTGTDEEFSSLETFVNELAIPWLFLHHRRFTPFEDLSQSAEACKPGRGAVIVCGPPGLTKSVREFCRKRKSLHFYAEPFEW